MKKMTGKRMIPLIAVLLALSMLITVFAMPDPLNVNRWPDPSNIGEAAILPGLYEKYYISPDNWRRTDYPNTYFSDNPLKPGEREDASRHCCNCSTASATKPTTPGWPWHGRCRSAT